MKVLWGWNDMRVSKFKFLGELSCYLSLYGKQLVRHSDSTLVFLARNKVKQVWNEGE